MFIRKLPWKSPLITHNFPTWPKNVGKKGWNSQNEVGVHWREGNFVLGKNLKLGTGPNLPGTGDDCLAWCGIVGVTQVSTLLVGHSTIKTQSYWPLHNRDQPNFDLPDDPTWCHFELEPSNANTGQWRTGRWNSYKLITRNVPFTNQIIPENLTGKEKRLDSK